MDIVLCCRNRIANESGGGRINSGGIKRGIVRNERSVINKVYVLWKAVSIS